MYLDRPLLDEIRQDSNSDEIAFNQLYGEGNWREQTSNKRPASEKLSGWPADGLFKELRRLTQSEVPTALWGALSPLLG